MAEEIAVLGKPTLLVVDDTPENLALMRAVLKDHYRVKVADGGEQAVRLAAAVHPPPDLILLDIMMPVMDGYATCRTLKSLPQTRNIPIIFLTAKSEVEDEIRGLQMGAVDYISKPITPPLVLARVSTQLELKKARDFLRNQNEFLDAEVHRRTREVMALQDVTIQAMASLAETRDNETGNHIRRTQHYVRVMAEYLRSQPRFRSLLDGDKTIDLLFKSAPLHDIGKVGIPDAILLKPGRLTPDEFEIMKTHTTLGRDAILAAEMNLEVSLPFLATAKEIAFSHQEKWDGSGYPLGLSGESIPVSARLMAVADVYDALISHRVYKQALPHMEATKIIVQGGGTHFDPGMVEGFLSISDEFARIAARYCDKGRVP